MGDAPSSRLVILTIVNQENGPAEPLLVQVKFVAEGSDVDAEKFGGFVAVTFGSFQRHPNEAFLHLLDGGNLFP